ncbi:MAG: replication initiator protein WhiP [Desulfurococcales archaeon]|nr:replication initiator protein WhiP [Desulfurococcales archaeon]
MRDVDYRTIAEALARQGSRRSRGRGGPRSRVVDAIMVLLLSKPMRAAEIASVLGFQSKYISSYLSYWKARGYVDYDRGFWYLTPLGEEYAHEIVDRLRRSLEDEYARLARSVLLSTEIVSSTIDGKRKPREPANPGKPQSFIAGLMSSGGNKRQGASRVDRVTCVLRLLKGRLDEEEFEVISTILSHYARWGSTYLYADQLQEKLQADQKWLFAKLRSLQTKNLIYIYADPRLGVRVGLSKALRETLEYCE